MTAQPHAFGIHHVGIIIPGTLDDNWDWIRFASHKLADRFGSADVALGMAGWIRNGEEVTSPAVVLICQTFPLSDLDLTILVGIAWQVYQALGCDGIAVMIDDDLIVL